MNYTKWMRENFPKLEHSTSAETFKILENAKNETKIYRLILTAIYILLSVTIVFNVGSLLNMDVLEGVIGFAVFIAVFSFVGYFKFKVEAHIIKNKIKTILCKAT